MNVPGFHKRMLCGLQSTSNAFRMVSMRELLFSVELTFVLFLAASPQQAVGASDLRWNDGRSGEESV